jgi:hypothetical protein
MSQVAFLIIFLFTFGERKSVSAFGAGNLNVWHVADSPTSAEPRTFHALALRNSRRTILFRSLGLRQDELAANVQFSACSRPNFENGQVGLSLLQRGEWFNKIRAMSDKLELVVHRDKLKEHLIKWKRQLLGVRWPGSALVRL